MPQNYSYYLLVGAWLQGLLTSPRGAIARVTGQINNVCPREDLAVMEKSGKYSPRLIAKLRRRQAAHDNYYEAIGVFSASVVSRRSTRLRECEKADGQVAANAAGVDPTYLNASSLVFLLARIAHCASPHRC